MRLLPFIALAASCTSTSSNNPPPDADLQMNDISVLLPLPQTQAQFTAMIAPTSPALGGALLPEDIYAKAPDEVDYASLRVVAFRLDPCFGQLGAITDPASCDNQLRVVFQPVSVDPTSNTTFVADAAVHAFYALTRAQLVDAVNELSAARVADNGDVDLGPLAPNPIIAHEGLDGPLAQAYAQIITKYAGATNLVRFTSFAVLELGGVPANGDVVGGEGQFWDLAGVDVANGAVTPMIIPTLPNAPTRMTLEANAMPLEATFSPMTTSSDDLDLLASFTQASAASPADRQAALDSALRILNPHDNSPNTIDCASCHMAQPAIQLVGEPLGMTMAGNPNAFVPAANIPAADLAQTTPLVDSDQVLNIHAFSYRSQSPMINQRVINETAANLAYLETL